MQDPSNSGAACASSIWRGTHGAALACATAILVLVAGGYLYCAVLAVRYPFGIDYGEGIVWHHPDGRRAKLKRQDFL
jgi:hypothetical protein